MRIFRRLRTVALLVPLMGLSLGAHAFTSPVVLNQGWRIQAADLVTAPASELSRSGFPDSSWVPSRAPSTVEGARVDAGIDPDPFYGMEFRKIPGTTYPIGSDFTKLPTPSDSLFQGAWWFRKNFDAAPASAGEHVWLKLDGLNFRANVWVNGVKIADSAETAGPFRRFEFDITAQLTSTSHQAVAIEIFPSSSKNLALTWIDWAPTPADKNMGLLNDVSITRTGPLRIIDPQVETELLIPSLSQADIKISTWIENSSDDPKLAEMQGSIEGVHFTRSISIAPHTRIEVVFNHASDPGLQISRPRIWWPRPIGNPELYLLDLQVSEFGRVSDERSVPFGVRKFSSSLDPNGNRLFTVNGRKILIRGGGWSPDLFLRLDPVRTENELRYLQHLNLNTVRLEGKLESDRFFEITDRLGILVMAGWSCCDRWQDGSHWIEEDRHIARESMKDQARRLRNHPSILAWLYGSDEPPPQDIEQMYLDVLREERWPSPTLSSASNESTPLTGPSGVKMTGPYEWVPPSYWLKDTEHGGAFGFNTETSPGPAIPPIETLREFLPPEHLWPIDEVWNFHAGGDVFKTIDVFKKALDSRYGPSSSVEEFAMKSQVAALESHRAMFEAFGRNKYRLSTGVVQWMLGNPWPSLIWHLYDHSLRPGGAYFGARLANEPLHIQYSYDDRSVVVVNDRTLPQEHLYAEISLKDFSLQEVFHSRQATEVGTDSVKQVLTIPAFEGNPNGPYFLTLRLEDDSGLEVSRNFYWLSTKPEVLDFAHSEWWMTPVLEYADFTRLNSLPPVSLLVRAEEVQAEGIPTSPPERRILVHVMNPSPTLAFSNHLKLVETLSGKEQLPVLWNDNYFALLPWETRTLEVRLPGVSPLEDSGSKSVGHLPLRVEWSGWNTNPARTDVETQ